MGTLSPPAECLGQPPVAYSLAICSMWSLSSLYCSARENEVTLWKGTGGTARQVLLCSVGQAGAHQEQ